MAGPSWRNVAATLATELLYQQCTEHRAITDGCPACADRAAMNTYRAAVEADTKRRLNSDEWLQVAYILGARMRVHADNCSDHPRTLPYGTCPYCDETRAWQVFEKKATAAGIRLPDQDHHDILDAADTINVAELFTMKDQNR